MKDRRLPTTMARPVMPEIKKKPLTIRKFSKHRIEFSDGTVITSGSGEFDINIIEAILKAGEPCDEEGSE